MFFFDDVCDDFLCDWFDVGYVGCVWVGYDCCWVVVDENDFVVFFM